MLEARNLDDIVLRLIIEEKASKDANMIRENVFLIRPIIYRVLEKK